MMQYIRIYFVNWHVKDRCFARQSPVRCFAFPIQKISIYCGDFRIFHDLSLIFSCFCHDFPRSPMMFNALFQWPAMLTQQGILDEPYSCMTWVKLWYVLKYIYNFTYVDTTDLYIEYTHEWIYSYIYIYTDTTYIYIYMLLLYYFILHHITLYHIHSIMLSDFYKIISHDIDSIH